MLHYWMNLVVWSEPNGLLCQNLNFVCIMLMKDLYLEYMLFPLLKNLLFHPMNLFSIILKISFTFPFIYLIWFHENSRDPAFSESYLDTFPIYYFIYLYVNFRLSE